MWVATNDVPPKQPAENLAPDYEALFRSLPGLFLVLTPALQIVAASDQYLTATMTNRCEIVGRDLFDVFPDNPNDPTATGTSNLRRSLTRVIRELVTDTMAVQKYDIRRPNAQGADFEERYWSPVNAPVLDHHGALQYIVHRVEDVTKFVQWNQRSGPGSGEGAVPQREAQLQAELFLRAQELQEVNQELSDVVESRGQEVRERRQAEQKAVELAAELRKLNEELQSSVTQRTSELRETDRALSREMVERHRAQELFRLSVEAAPNAMVIADQSGRIVLVNRETEVLFGYPRSELLGQSVEILLPDRFRDKHPQQRAEYLRTPIARPMGRGRELFARRRDGSEFPVEIALNPIESEHGILILSAIVDITERKKVEEERRQSDLRFRAIFNESFGLIGLLDVDGVVLEMNQAALNFRALREEDVVGQKIWETSWLGVSPEIQQEVRAAVEIAAAGNFVRKEISVRDRHGDQRILDFSVKPVRNEAGVVELLIPEGRDITEHKRLEEQFRQAQKLEAIGKLAGGIAHDFNNLLTVILGYTEFLNDSFHERDPLREMVEQIHAAANRAAGLTRQLLAFSRKQVLIPVLLNLNEHIAGMERFLARLIGEDIDLVFCPAADLQLTRVDVGQLEQILMNLLVNSRDAMPRGGKITIETANAELDADYCSRQSEAVPGDYVLLAVTDTGCGISRETRDRIFEPFFTTKGDQGTGLGLSTVYGIVKQSGGHIAVYSEPQCGTTFKIYFPRVQAASNSLVAQKTRNPAQHGTETILLVEDEAGLRALARTVLQRRGYRVLEAASGAEALAISEGLTAPVHLLATDVVMPDMSGRELAERLHILRPEMKVLYMSGYMDDAVVRHGLLNAEVPFLQKPYNPSALATKVRDVLDAAPTVASATGARSVSDT